MTFLAILFTVAACVWLIPLLRRSKLVDMLLAFLVTGTIFGVPFFSVDGPVQISIDRVIWCGMIFWALVQLRLGQVVLPKLTRIDYLMILLVLYLFWSSRGGDIEQTLIDPTARWLFYILMPLGVYLVVRLDRISQRDFTRFLKVIIAIGLYLSVTAVLEVKGVHAFVFPRFIIDSTIWEFFGRGRGPLLNPVGNGFVIGVAMSAVAVLFVGADRQRKALYATLGMILLMGAYATLTRSCWLGVVGAAATVFMIQAPRWVRIWGLAATVLFIGALTLGLKDQLLALKRDKDLSAAQAAKSIELRPLLAIVAWEMFKDKPITGHGYGHYFAHSDGYHAVRGYDMPLEEVRPYNHHNTFLAFLVDSGLIGFGIYVSILIMLAGKAWQMFPDSGQVNDRGRVGMFAIAVLVNYFPNAMFHEMTIIPMVQMYLFSIAGYAVTIHQNGFARQERSVRSPAIGSQSVGPIGSQSVGSV